MKRYLAFAGVALVLLVAAWVVWGGGEGEGEARRPGASRSRPGAPALRWSGGDGPGEEKRESRTEPGAVVGRVVDAIDGRPISGATVTLRSDGGEELDETSSEEDGSFSFEESGEAVLVAAAAPGYAIRAKDLDAGEIVLDLDGAVTVSGVVVDPAGDPVADAEVWVEDRERAFLRPPTVSSTVRTDAEGRFVLEDSPSGTLIVHAEHSDFAAAVAELGGLGPGRNKDGVRIVLGDTGSLAGRVADETGVAAAGAAMTWLPVDRDRWRDADVTAVAGADGRYRFPHVPAGRGVVRARTAAGEGGTEAEIVLGAEVSADFVVETLPLLTGTVVDAGDRPVAGATVSIERGWRDRGRAEPREATTDAGGRFSLRVQADDTVTLSARLANATGTETVQPDSGPVVIRLEALGVARVRVLGGDGKPYLGDGQILVQGRRADGGRWGNMRPLALGTATIEGAAGEWRVRALVGTRDDDDAGPRDRDDDAPLRDGEVKVPVAAAPPETDVILRIPASLPALVPVRGRVVGPDGAPVVGARISVFAESRDWAGGTGARLDWSRAVRSDVSGRFVIEAPPGTQKLFVYHPEFRTELATVVVPAQGEGDAGVIRLESGSGSSAVFEFSGIGAVLALDDQQRCMIREVVAGGPAERAGVRGKDVLLEVDGVALHGMNLGDVIERIRGPVGTTVTLRLERPGNLEPFLLDVVRDKIRT